MYWDRHEIDTRTKIKKIIEKYRVNGELFGLSPDLDKSITILRRQDIDMATDEVYQLILREMKCQT